MKDRSVLNSHSMSPSEPVLEPRKSPIQARSAATIQALHVATIQVLTREGLSRCTTTRIATRAGISVGSLYQYYPNRDALLAASLRRHLDGVADAVEMACRHHHGKPVAVMAEALVAGFLAEKLRNPEESKALYAVAGERGGADLVARMRSRSVAAMAAMLTTAADAFFDDPMIVADIALSAMVGPVRAVLQAAGPPGLQDRLAAELIPLVAGYFERRGSPVDAGSAEHLRPSRQQQKEPPSRAAPSLGRKRPNGRTARGLSNQK